MAKKIVRRAERSSFLDWYKPNFNTLLRAAENGDLALVELRDRSTGQLAAGVCAVSHSSDEFVLVPMATLCSGNPYYIYDPPQDGDPAPLAEGDRLKMAAQLELLQTQVAMLRDRLGLARVEFPEDHREIK